MKAQNNSKIVLDIDNELSFDPKNIADHSNNFFLNNASNKSYHQHQILSPLTQRFLENIITIKMYCQIALC